MPYDPGRGRRSLEVVARYFAKLGKRDPSRAERERRRVCARIDAAPGTRGHIRLYRIREVFSAIPGRDRNPCARRVVTVSIASCRGTQFLRDVGRFPAHIDVASSRIRSTRRRDRRAGGGALYRVLDARVCRIWTARREVASSRQAGQVSRVMLDAASRDRGIGAMPSTMRSGRSSV